VDGAPAVLTCPYQFVPLQPVSTAIGKRVGQARWLSIISLGWGIVTLGHAFVKTKGQVIAVRLLIGVFEAGFYPTCETKIYSSFQILLERTCAQAMGY